jgi:acyl carrier protein
MCLALHVAGARVNHLDLHIDSISIMTIVVNAEEKFDVTIPDDEVKNLTTVGDAVGFIAKNQG